MTGGTTPEEAPHSCDNCSGVDPGSCINTPASAKRAGLDLRARVVDALLTRCDLMDDDPLTREDRCLWDTYWEDGEGTPLTAGETADLVMPMLAEVTAERDHLRETLARLAEGTADLIAARDDLTAQLTAARETVGLLRGEVAALRRQRDDLEADGIEQSQGWVAALESARGVAVALEQENARLLADRSLMVRALLGLVGDPEDGEPEEPNADVVARRVLGEIGFVDGATGAPLPVPERPASLAPPNPPPNSEVPADPDPDPGAEWVGLVRDAAQVPGGIDALIAGRLSALAAGEVAVVDDAGKVFKYPDGTPVTGTFSSARAAAGPCACCGETDYVLHAVMPWGGVTGPVCARCKHAGCERCQGRSETKEGLLSGPGEAGT